MTLLEGPSRLPEAPKLSVAISRRGLSPRRLRRVLDFVEAHLADNIPLAALALEAGMSNNHFCTMFHRAVGRPPHRHVIERRLERAKTLLRAQPSATVTNIAMSVGFNSSAHFSTMFRKTVGATPIAYREDAQVASH